MGSAPEGMDVGDDADGQSLSFCAQCLVQITNTDESTVVCQGKCKRYMHCACLPDVVPVVVNSVRRCRNIRFACDACLLLDEREVNTVLGFERKLQELLTKVDALSCVVDMAEKFESKVKKIVNEEFVRINKRSIAAAEDKDPNWRGRLRSASKKRKMDERNVEEQNDNDTPKPEQSFADIVKEQKESRNPAKNKLPEKSKKPDPVMIIKPKVGQDISNTKEILKAQVNPKNLNVNRVVQGKDGALVITLGDEVSRNTLKETVEKKMGDKFEVKVRENMKPTVKIVDMNEEYDEEGLKETLVDQNDCFDDLKHFKLRKLYHNEKRQYAQYSAIVELDAPTFFKVMEVDRLNCGWDRCRVFDGLDVTRCFKCCGFNHKFVDCKAEQLVCPICSGNHLVKECKATEQKCANCEKMRRDRKLNIDVDHAAWSSQCPVYLRLRKRRSEQVDFTT